MSKVYIPFENVNDYACYSVNSGEVIRAYKTTPITGSTSDYVDFYINSHYLEKEGTQNFSQYSTLPTCISKDKMTNLYSYRNDFADICVISIILIGSVWYLIGNLIKRLFKGKKVF